ncbi:AAA family ATPase, putative [Plasmodium gallinaceum]|uniref:AAA family ATPase, putative n=1 Tax=Plasmodium gallinaceum TaxID=5849 RepID=A0A1J1GSY4_PLAGA|nr:AAA family ATPase, putative [Plasmodium gallinaceum]CRG95646.1 AAA family ATPase, putative [Plasmodium gallinaceum]
MYIKFYLYDDEEEKGNIASNFNIYCSNDLLKELKLNIDDNAVIRHKLKDNEDKSFCVCCCFKNYNELNLKKKLDCYSVYTNSFVLKSLNVNLKNENNNGKPYNIKVEIIKAEVYVPIKEIKLIIKEIFNEPYENLKEYYIDYTNDILQSFWKNIKSKNIDKYINLSLLNTCLFQCNVIKLCVIGVHTYLYVKDVIFQFKNKKSSQKNSHLDNNFYVPYINQNTKIVIEKIDDNENEESVSEQKYDENVKENENQKENKKENMKNGRKEKINISECENRKKNQMNNYLKKKGVKRRGLKKIGGYNKIKEDIYYYILLPLIYKNIYDEFNIDINRGILLHGPPGCGKTYIALAIKEELLLLKKKINDVKLKNKIDFFTNIKSKLDDENEKKALSKEKKSYEIDYNDDIILPEMEILKSTDLIDNNNSGEKINELFLRCYKRYKEEKKCSIIFIDEIEILCEKRENCNINLYTSTLLNNMDGIKKHTHTILIGATNYINLIDLALRRSGRFDKDIEINIPNLKDRISIFKSKLSKINHNISFKKIKEIADLCQSFTCADINALINVSMFIYLKENNIISHKIFKKSIKNSQIDEGKGKKMHTTNNNEKEQVNHSIIDEHIKKNDDENKFSKLYIKQKKKTNCEELSIGNSDSFTILSNENKYTLRYKHLIKGLKYVKPSGMKELYVDIPKTRIKDIGGYKFVKRCIKECLIYPKKYEPIYEKYNILSPKGILLYGPPGCSKTLFAKAIASEINMNFISVKGPEIFSKYVGESEKTIRNIFKKARENNPCVIFFDEIDSIAMNRNINQNFVSNRVLCQLLNEIDGICNRIDVIILAATNRPDLIDPALLRPGRFDRIIYVPLPNYSSRFSILKKTLKFYKINNMINQKKEVCDNDNFCKNININENSNIDLNIESKIEKISEYDNVGKKKMKTDIIDNSVNYISEKTKIEKRENENNEINNEKHYFDIDVDIYNNIDLKDDEKLDVDYRKNMDAMENYNSNNSHNLNKNNVKKIIKKRKEKKNNNNNNNYDNNFIELCHFLAKNTKKYSGAEIVNICREASICALRETLKKYKNENHEKKGSFNNIDFIGLRKEHFIMVLKKIKPQTSEKLINFYKNYNEQKKY